jgi:CRISPR/Cas system-associated exonuclease Cas4 (RecB family)
MKYFIEYHLGIPETRKGNIYTHKGSAVHEALELWTNAVLGLEGDKSEIDYKKTLLKYYKESKLWMLDIRNPDKGGDPYPQEKNCEICPFATKSGVCSIAAIPTTVVDGCPRGNYEADLALVEGAIFNEDFPVLKRYKSGKKKGQFKKKVLAAEQSFDMEIEGVPVRGVIDLVVEEDPDTIEIVDYKTGRSMSYNAAFMDAQVRIYGKVIGLMYPQYKTVMVTLWFLKKTPVTVTMTPDMDEKTVKSLQKNDRLIRNNINPQRIKSWLCNYCIGWEACGKLKDSFKVDGKFVLPTISCRHYDPQKKNPCWGRLAVENPEETSVEKANEMTYACKGHRKIQTGGDYTPEVPDKTD